MLPKKLQQKINQRKENHIFRSLIQYPKNWTDFASNDYLGFAKNKKIKELWVKEIRNLPNGSGGSRLITGNDIYTESVEEYLQEYYNGETALLMPSGYNANVSIFSTLPQKGDTILYDEWVHASIRDGIRLSFANQFSFKHNDSESLEKKLKNASGEIYVAVESIYSMEGDLAFLKQLVLFKKKYNFHLILDEAHSTGILGKNGKGLYEDFVPQDFFIRIHTFGKALGAHGAVIICEKAVKEYLINFSRPFIYTTACPPHQWALIKVAHQHLHHIGNEEREKLFQLINYCENKKIKNYNKKSPIFTFESPNLSSIEKNIWQHKICIKAIYPPTVPQGKERLRICLHSFNTTNEIEILHSLLQ